MTIDLPAARQDSLPERIQYSQALAVSNLLPAQYRGKPENVLYAIEFGRSLGIEPIAAITGVHIIEGKPSASSGLISALVRRAGHRLRVWVERDSNGTLIAAVATIIRRDDPDFTFRSTWTMGRAQAAGLTNKAVWKSYPEAMLKARAISEVAREACEEELSGVGYTPEELGAEVNGDGSVVVTTAPARANQPGQTIRDAVTPPVAPPSAPVADEPPGPGLVSEPSERMISQDQQKKMFALMREHRITDKPTALAFVSEVIGRDVESRNDLTMAEARRVIDRLEKEPRPGASTSSEPAGDEADGDEHDEAQQ
ncbi:recombinase RecT [Streptosporangium sp. DT93]|uniref:recombinase RecT n=1 Tax=Streptosporangium sp. DT93 TaxID=3393428 RepID=UPI003CF93CAE